MIQTMSFGSEYFEGSPVWSTPGSTWQRDWGSIGQDMDCPGFPPATTPSTTVDEALAQGSGLYEYDASDPDPSERYATTRKRKPKSRIHEVDRSTQMRRRAQNRESQRAFRARKENAIQTLQTELVNLHLRHRDLRELYRKQCENLDHLRALTASLTTELVALRATQHLGLANTVLGLQGVAQNAFASWSTPILDQDAQRMNLALMGDGCGGGGGVGGGSTSPEA